LSYGRTKKLRDWRLDDWMIVLHRNHPEINFSINFAGQYNNFIFHFFKRLINKI